MPGKAGAQPDRAVCAGGLAGIADALRTCRRCPLWANATQAVPGAGAPGARLMLVGEQPGDREDLEGLPFVGPAGRMLDKALAEAGIAREGVWLTNAVKHFKYERRGRRRLHKRPNAYEIDACRWWLGLEIEAVRPLAVVAMGTTAVRGVLGKSRSIASLRGAPATLPDGTRVHATVHPSYLLRLPDAASRHREYARFVADLAAASP